MTISAIWVAISVAISVWTVSVLRSGDIVCGVSDSVVGVLTRDSTRVADEAVLEDYEHGIWSQALNRTQGYDMEEDKLPGEEALWQHGTKEAEVKTQVKAQVKAEVKAQVKAQVKVIGKGDVVEAHQWSSASARWRWSAG